jgi:hypothetical protein
MIDEYILRFIYGEFSNDRYISHTFYFTSVTKCSGKQKLEVQNTYGKK